MSDTPTDSLAAAIERFNAEKRRLEALRDDTALRIEAVNDVLALLTGEARPVAKRRRAAWPVVVTDEPEPPSAA